MILGILISDLASSLFSKLQLWLPIVSRLSKAGNELRFVGEIHSQNDPVLQSSTILGATLEKILEEYNTFRTGVGYRSNSGGSPLPPMANGYLTFGFPRCLPHPQKTVFSIGDLNHWTAPDSYSEADRLQAQASIFRAMEEARGLLFWSADLLADFERLFPNWLVETRKLYRLINVTSSGIEACGNKLSIDASGGSDNSIDFCNQTSDIDVAGALSEFYHDLGLT
jgi:hypothetical protein